MASGASSDVIRRYLWLDLEMSGLDVSTCRILEVAAIVTDLELNEIESYHQIVFQRPEVLAAMDDWCTQQHGKSGLTAAVAKGKPEADVERELLGFIDRHWKSNERVVLAGNSIWTDRRFVEACWPQVTARLHYRMLDVSSWKVLLKERFHLKYEKRGQHRAVDDVRESIGELKYYLSHFTVERRPVA